MRAEDRRVELVEDRRWAARGCRSAPRRRPPARRRCPCLRPRPSGRGRCRSPRPAPVRTRQRTAGSRSASASVCVERFEHREADRVQTFRAVQRDDADAVVAQLVEQVGHGDGQALPTGAPSNRRTLPPAGARGRRAPPMLAPRRDDLDAVFLDAGNTLITLDHALVCEVLRGRGVTAHRADGAGARRGGGAAGGVARSSPAASPASAATPSPSTSTRILVGGWVPTRPDGPALCRRASCARSGATCGRSGLWSQVLPGVPDALRALRARGPAPGGRQQFRRHGRGRALARWACAPQLDAVVDSAVVGAEKPDPAIFRHALATCRSATRADAARRRPATPSTSSARGARGCTPCCSTRTATGRRRRLSDAPTCRRWRGRCSTEEDDGDRRGRDVRSARRRHAARRTPRGRGRRARRRVSSSIPDVRGLTEHYRDVARRFAAEGFFALAVDLYSREGAPDLPDMDGGLRAGSAQLPDPRVLGDLGAAVHYLGAPPRGARRRASASPASASAASTR